MPKPVNRSLEVARKFANACFKPRFFSAENTECMQRALKSFFTPPWFQGTDACKRFLLEYDVCGVGYAENDLFPDVSPREWLASLGIDVEKGAAGIFDVQGAEEYEQKQLRRYKRFSEHHRMVGYRCADSDAAREAARTKWGKLLDHWEKEFVQKYHRSPL